MSNATPEQLVEALTAPETFDARAAVTGATAAKSTVRLFRDGETAGALKEIQDALQEAEWKQREHSAEATGGMTHTPEYEVWGTKVEELKAQEAAVIQKVLESSLVFHVRGVPTKVRNLIVQSWTRKFPDAKRGHFGEGQEGEDEFDAAMRERMSERYRNINNEFIAKSIFKVVDVQGREDTRVWTPEDVDGIYENYYESEYQRLLAETNKVSMANSLFNEMIAQDADFLSKP
jgi:hypothetical protein